MAMQPVPVLPAVEYAERSDPGRDPDKQVNEDVCAHRATRFGHLCVVCDGMGGHAAGREAAELAVATVFQVFEEAEDNENPAALLKRSIEEASRRVYEMRTSEVALGRPGSTAVAVLLHARGTEVVHVGDSRVYLVHEGQILRLTRDHSIVQELVDRGLLSPEQAARHPEANRITRALGMSVEVGAELRPEAVHQVAGDAFVLCSDGLCDLVGDDEILAIVGSEPAAQAVGKLVDLANARGGHDNVTVAVLRARETAGPGAAALPPTIPQTTIMQPPAPAVGTALGSVASVGSVGPAGGPIGGPIGGPAAGPAGGPIGPATTSAATIVDPPRAPLEPGWGRHSPQVQASRGQADSPERRTEPQRPVGVMSPQPREPPAREPPVFRPEPAPGTRRGTNRMLVFVAVLLAAVAFALLGVVLFAHLQERGGRKTPAIAAEGGAG
jgi:protein phosphatase